MDENRIDKIQKTLLEHPEGLTIRDLAEYCGVVRDTMASDMKMLVGRGDVHLREIGPAKLHYHNKHAKKFINNAK